jgi:hypothetical protein
MVVDVLNTGNFSRIWGCEVAMFTLRGAPTLGVFSLVKVEITALCFKVLAIWHHNSLNEISTEQSQIA